MAFERKMKNLFDDRLHPTEHVHYQLSPEELIADTLSMGGGALNNTGALVINTGEFTGRSPKDRFIVKDETTEGKVHWNEFNIPIEPRHFDKPAASGQAAITIETRQVEFFIDPISNQSSPR